MIWFLDGVSCDGSGLWLWDQVWTHLLLPTTPIVADDPHHVWFYLDKLPIPLQISDNKYIMHMQYVTKKFDEI